MGGSHHRVPERNESTPDRASGAVRRALALLLLPCVLATVVGAVLVYPFGHERPTGAEAGLGRTPVPAEITAVSELACDPQPGATPAQEVCTTVTARLAGGPASGQSVTMPVASGPGAPRYAVGDKVVLAYSGAEPLNSESYEVTDFQRRLPMLLLALLFAAAVLALGRWRGLAALAAMVLSFVVLVVLVLPAILAGENPLLVALVGGGLIMFTVLYLTHGISARTSTAVAGTLTSLAFIGVLAFGFSAAARLTGMDDDTATLTGMLGHGIDTRGLLLAGIVIGALGVLDDVTVTQTSAVWELRRANPDLSWRELFAAAQRIGRDHIASVVNTLVMAYTGAALPLLLALYLSGRHLGDVATAEQVAQEIVRTLVGSIGLVAAVPITTLVAAYVARRQGPAAAPAEPPGPPAGAPPPLRRRRTGRARPAPDDRPGDLFRAAPTGAPAGRARVGELFRPVRTGDAARRAWAGRPTPPGASSGPRLDQQ